MFSPARIMIVWLLFKKNFFKIVIYPLYLSDHENKWTCQEGHKNDIKCISKSFKTLCNFLYIKKYWFFRALSAKFTSVKIQILYI